MNLLVEVPGAKRARFVMVLVLVIGGATVRSADRVVTQWFDGLHLPEPPGATQWDIRSMWEL